MSYEDYWYQQYSLEQEPSNGLIRLLKIDENFQFNRALDMGCGEGRNFSIIKKYSRYLVGIEPNQNAAKKAIGLNISDEVVINTIDQYSQNDKGLYFDFIVAWRVLHLGTFDQCLKNIEITTNLLSPRGYLALAVSDIACSYFDKTRLEPGGSEIEQGTILRSTKNNDARHFFSRQELENVNKSLKAIKLINFEERKGSSAKKIKKYWGVLYQKCQS